MLAFQGRKCRCMHAMTVMKWHRDGRCGIGAVDAGQRAALDTPNATTEAPCPHPTCHQAHAGFSQDLFAPLPRASTGTGCTTCCAGQRATAAATGSRAAAGRGRTGRPSAVFAARLPLQLLGNASQRSAHAAAQQQRACLPRLDAAKCS